MSHPVSFTRAALAEASDAQDWYESEAAGLGVRFRSELDQVVERIASNPRQFPAIYKDLRRALLRRFPYALIFVIEPDEAVTLVACFHGSRNPQRWQKRL